ncbi:NAD-dependent epimerase/dehydratase family protein [Chitinophaga silvatica]|uniref:NAD-dependent epimerase/dehydratase family protein n=1 Tax=Chitinophaga silvatica TaxID=2282649 RepID=A0A3E1YCG5_9BACT|nr:SDR family oxidoreductase [Chitinophaga silvatica]RFS23945.1 NAD-dependent epimerase/dehydratase family protein [Chitinophaga silvatica]
MYNIKYHNQDLSSFSFLITGGAGFIGSNIVEYLLKYNAGKVRVLDNLSTGKMENIEPFLSNPAFEFVEADIRDFSACEQALENIDFVSHQAALGSVPRSVKDPITTNEVNVSGFLNMLVAARNANVKQFVYAASSSTYGDSKKLPKVEEQIGKPLSPYAVTKYVNELYADVFAKVYNFNSIGLRYFNVFGPKQDPYGAYAAVIPLFFKAALNNTPPTINGDGNQTRDFTFIENAVQANIKALLHPHQQNKAEVINIAVGENTTLNNLWNEICKIVGTELNANHGPDRAGDIRDSLADISKAQQLIGYDPAFNLSTALVPTFNWYKTQNFSNLNV